MNEPADWLSRMGEPFFRSRQEAESYVLRELSIVLPKGWEIERSSQPHLTWILRRQKPPDDEWQCQEYSVQVSDGLDLIILTHGNADVGPFRLRHVLQNALVMRPELLRAFTLSRCIEFLFEHCKPNEWGHT